MKNPIFFWLIVLFGVINILDIITVHLVGFHGEANPLFLLLGTVWPIILLKLLVIGAFFYLYQYNKYRAVFFYFLILLILIAGTVFTGIGVATNILADKTTNYTEQVSSVTTTEKIQYYTIIAVVVYVLPIFLASITFLFFEYSKHSIIIRKPK